MAKVHVNDINASLSFWRDALGFQVACQPPEETFVYLAIGDAEVMLCQRHGRYETGAMARPLGQGVMFQLSIDSIDPALAALDWPLYEPPREA